MNTDYITLQGHVGHSMVTKTRDTSPRLRTKDALGHLTPENTNPDPTIKIIRELLYLGNKPGLNQQYLSLETVVTRKVLSLLNIQTANQETIYEGLRQDNLLLPHQVIDLNKELRSTILARTP